MESLCLMFDSAFSRWSPQSRPNRPPLRLPWLWLWPWPSPWLGSWISMIPLEFQALKEIMGVSPQFNLWRIYEFENHEDIVVVVVVYIYIYLFIHVLCEHSPTSRPMVCPWVQWTQRDATSSAPMQVDFQNVWETIAKIGDPLILDYICILIIYIYTI